MIISSYNALQVLPEDSWPGVALIFLAFVLAVVDLKVTNHGLPTLVGLVALILGVLLLFNTLAPFLWALLIPLGVIMLLMGVLLIRALGLVRAAKQRPVTTGGMKEIIGEVGVVKEPVGVSFPGWVLVHGELWRAVAIHAPEDAYYQARREQVIGIGRKVLVVGLEDRTAVVMLFEPTALEYSTES